MDSLTQIVLGAACGEVALGKKIGNKAMLFGAIGGTIPDLDVILGGLLYGNEIDAMAFHRGFMHSIVFAILGSLAFGYLMHKLYDRGIREGTTTQRDWIWLFFLSIFTHPILDSFTPYGTQLFLPFSNYRVAFNNISVADPLYTLPFLICVIVAMCYKRGSLKRIRWNRAGLIISSVYMLLTIVNKLYVDSVFKASFDKQVGAYQRFSAQPSILNNVLWYGIAETETDYKVGFYSIFDSKPEITNFLSLPKNHDLVNNSHPDIKTMTWFSNNYYNIQQIGKDSLRYNDLRYPLFNTDDPNSSVFSFLLKEKGKRWDIEPFIGIKPKAGDMAKLWERIKGQ